MVENKTPAISPGFARGCTIYWLFKLLLLYVLILLIGFFDFLLGFEISLSLFYLISIIFATWHFNQIQGIILSFFATLIWLTADILSGHQYNHTFIPFWNIIVRFSFFLIITLLLSKIKYLLKKEQKFARIDYLTGLSNTRDFFEYAEKIIKRSQINNDTVTIIYIDLDNFKYVNDTNGHEAGDILLQKVSAIIRDNIRPTDIAARLGGDEFAMLIPLIDEIRAVELVKNIQKNVVQEMNINKWPVTLSIGIAIYKKISITIEKMIKEADSLMYTVKKSGKNSYIKKIIDT